MKKLLARTLGLTRETTELQEKLDKAKAELARVKEERNALRAKLETGKPFLNTELSRLLADGTQTQLNKEQLAQLVSWDSRTSFSQYGEDSVASYYLQQEKEKGIIVDIGAYHPFRFSNTFLFHLKGWKTVSVDASAEAIDLFNAIRPTDTNICTLVSDKTETLKYYQFAEGAWNTTNSDIVPVLAERGLTETQLVSTTEMQTQSIVELLEQHVGSQKFDLLDIDVEGMDIQLLLGIDLTIYRPRLIFAEINEKNLTSPPVRDHLERGGYKLRGYCGNSALLLRQ